MRGEEVFRENKLLLYNVRDTFRVATDTVH
jgi:hypothetical protein